MAPRLLRTSIASLLLAGLANAESQGPAIPDAAVLEQGSSIVLGTFTGATRAHVETRSGLFDDDGQPLVSREVVTLHDFRVHEVLGGAALPDVVTLALPGGAAADLATPLRVAVPERLATRVVLSLQPDGNERFVVAYGRVFDAEGPERLAALRAQTAGARQAEPLSADAELEARLAATEPLPELDRRSLVSGFFTGESRPVVDQHWGLSDDGREAVLHEETFTLAEFAVSELVDGVPLPRRVTLLLPRDTELPSRPGERLLCDLEPNGCDSYLASPAGFVPEADLERAAIARSLGRVPRAPRPMVAPGIGSPREAAVGE